MDKTCLGHVCMLGPVRELVSTGLWGKQEQLCQCVMILLGLNDMRLSCTKQKLFCRLSTQELRTRRLKSMVAWAFRVDSELVCQALSTLEWSENLRGGVGATVPHPHFRTMQTWDYYLCRNGFCRWDRRASRDRTILVLL